MLRVSAISGRLGRAGRRKLLRICNAATGEEAIRPIPVNIPQTKINELRRRIAATGQAPNPVSAKPAIGTTFAQS
jgi:hypothetical protein